MYSPHYQPIAWSVRVAQDDSVDSLLCRLLDIGKKAWHGKCDSIVPINPQRRPGYAMVLLFPSFLQFAEPVPLIPTLLDVSALGGTYFATALPQGLTVLELREYIMPHTRSDVYDFVVYLGDATEPIQSDEPLQLQAGDVLTAQQVPPTSIALDHLFEPGAEWTTPDQLPMNIQTPAFCILFEGERYLLRQGDSPGSSVYQATCNVLRLDQEEVTVYRESQVTDLDVQGTACHALLHVVRMPKRQEEDPARAARRDVFVTCDFRPLGNRLQLCYAHTHNLHIPSLLALAPFVVPENYELVIQGGRVVWPDVYVQGSTVLIFSLSPVSPPSSATDLRIGDDDDDGDDDDFGGRFRRNSRGQVFWSYSDSEDEGSQGSTPFSAPVRSRSPRQHMDQVLDGKFLSVVQLPAQAMVCVGWLNFPACLGLLDVCVQNAAPDCAKPTQRHPRHFTCHIKMKQPFFSDAAGDAPRLGQWLENRLQQLLDQPNHLYTERGLPPPVWQIDPDTPGVQVAEPDPFINALFVILTPGYDPDLVAVPLRVPCTVADALDFIEDVRIEERQARFDQVVPATPQPSPHYATLLAVPSWVIHQVAVLFDLTQFNNTFFSAVLPAVQTREQLLTITGLGQGAQVQLFVSASTQPALVQVPMLLMHGDTITIVPWTVAPNFGSDLHTMLQSTDGWDPNAPIPGREELAWWVLNDAHPFRFLIDTERRAHIRPDLAPTSCKATPSSSPCGSPIQECKTMTTAVGTTARSLSPRKPFLGPSNGHKHGVF